MMTIMSQLYLKDFSKLLAFLVEVRIADLRDKRIPSFMLAKVTVRDDSRSHPYINFKLYYVSANDPHQVMFHEVEKLLFPS